MEQRVLRYAPFHQKAPCAALTSSAENRQRGSSAQRSRATRGLAPAHETSTKRQNKKRPRSRSSAHKVICVLVRLAWATSKMRVSCSPSRSPHPSPTCAPLPAHDIPAHAPHSRRNDVQLRKWANDCVRRGRRSLSRKKQVRATNIASPAQPQKDTPTYQPIYTGPPECSNEARAKTFKW